MQEIYINEEHLGDYALENDARILVSLMKLKGWNVFYGVVINPELSDEDMQRFHMDFSDCLMQLE